ncbi:MAG: hypothetical protein U0835_26410 [Isosphaeraceae bacterium]
MTDARRTPFPPGRYFYPSSLREVFVLVVLAGMGVWSAHDQAVRWARPTLVNGEWVPAVTIDSRGRAVTMSVWGATCEWAGVSLVLSWGIVQILASGRGVPGRDQPYRRGIVAGSLAGGLAGAALWASWTAGPPREHPFTPYLALLVTQFGAVLGWLWVLGKGSPGRQTKPLRPD